MAHDFNTPPLPLEALTLHPRHHWAALWWLGWRCRNPSAFRDSLDSLDNLLKRPLDENSLAMLDNFRKRSLDAIVPWKDLRAVLLNLRPLDEIEPFADLRAVVRIYLHALPWVWILAVLCRSMLLETGLVQQATWWRSFWSEWQWMACLTPAPIALAGALMIFLLYTLVDYPNDFIEDFLCVGLVFGLVFGVTFGISTWTVSGLVIGLGLGLIMADASGSGSGLYDDANLLLRINLVVCAVIGLGGALLGGFWIGLSLTSGFLIGYYRPFYLVPHALLWPLLRKPAWYRFHPAAWDCLCGTPLPCFDRLLLRFGELAPDLAEREIARLIRETPGQRLPALRALTILRARRAAGVERIGQVTDAVADLPEGARGFLSQTRRVRELVETIVKQQVRVDSTSRPYFREIEARNLVAEVLSFRNRISGFHEPLATEFRKASDKWLELAGAQAAKAAEAAQAEPAPPVFRAGESVAGGKEAFVPRFRVLEELEGQVMLGSDCPGVLLRAPRHMGKSSLLKNVPGFLPKEVAVAFVSLQSAQLFSSIVHFVGGLAEAVEGSLPVLAEFDSVKQSVRSNRPADLAGFLRFLGDCNTALERAGWRLLLALDEYEMLDEKLREGVFTKDLLATLRESIQSHRRIIWAFSGNADITELTGADWTSYLISVRTLEVPLFTPEETRLLLTEPLKHSALREEDKARSALFWREFWGEDGIARIHTESGGWPYFVQLIAETAVTLANESASGAKPPPALLEQALDESVSRGRIAFHQLLRSQCRVPGEWEYLVAFAQRDSQPPPADAAVHRLLKRRQLLTKTPGGEWRLVVPLMARWLRKEG